MTMIGVVGLSFLFGASSAFAGGVLSDDTKLVDVAPGSTLRIVKPFRVCSGEQDEREPWFHAAGLVSSSTFAWIIGDPACVTLPVGTPLPIIGATLTNPTYFGLNDKVVSPPSVELRIANQYLRAVSAMQTSIFGHRRDSLTIKDLRRALGWSVWIEGADNSSVADGGAVKIVASQPVGAGQSVVQAGRSQTSLR